MRGANTLACDSVKFVTIIQHNVGVLCIASSAYGF